MRKLSLLLLVTMTFTLTSCWEFNRQQNYKNAENRGKSTLIEAESSKKAMIEQAKAEAQAEIERAKGVAEANRIIGESMKGNKEYLEYLKIDAIKTGRGDKIYIPTEAGIPILEARP